MWAKHRLRRREPVSLLENVPAYDDLYLPELLEGHFEILSARFCPTQLGYKAARPRFYCLLVEKPGLPGIASWISRRRSKF